MLNRDRKFIDQALSLATTSKCPKWRLGAIVARGNRVVSSGVNKFRNPPSIDFRNATVHAEVAAILSAGERNLRGTTIYVARVGKRRDARMARPCADCMKVIIGMGVKRIVYTNEVGMISEERVF